MVWMPSDVACCMGLPRSLSQSTGSPLIPDAGATVAAAAGSFPSADGDLSIRVSPRGHRRHNSFSYFRLPTDPLLRLSVLKLDGSSFDVQIAKTACVGELKEAIEELFSQPSKDGSCIISWSHVWGHFCLSYNEYTLTNDKACLRNFGIKDGDQLHFIRHLSLNHGPSEGSLKNHGTDSIQQRKSLTGSKVHNEVAVKDKNKDHEGVASSQFVDEQNDDDDDDDDDQIGRMEFKLRRLFRGLFPYAKLGTSQDDEYSKAS
ncbi:uncharacterized protein LOC135642601 [Musa acuminata AAA Group]|uniref:uncharacterized protein LOC103974911 n=1 Tax=Musa acuminata AAA Group TaxID=214697 RepID=UPI0031DE7ADA